MTLQKQILEMPPILDNPMIPEIPRTLEGLVPKRELVITDTRFPHPSVVHVGGFASAKRAPVYQTTGRLVL